MPTEVAGDRAGAEPAEFNKLGYETPLPVLPSGSKRLMSLDALRGFDMFWIIGADSLVEGLRNISASGPLKFIHQQLQHKQWEGFAFEDLIFPLFVFMVGASLVFSLSKAIERGGRTAALRRVIVRGLVLYVIGVLYYGGFSRPWVDPETHRHTVRLVGVLQRIALSYLFAGLLFLFLRPKGLIIATAALLLVYWALMSFVPVPGEPKHSYAEGHNLANYVDSRFLPGRKWDGDHDPEGLLSTIPAIGTCLLGVFAGLLLRNEKVRPMTKVGYLLAAGVVAAGLGWLWNFQFPVIKKLWTSSYVLVAGGYSAILLAVFYLVIDVLQLRVWARPFVWIGMNAITLYVIFDCLLPAGRVAERFVGGDIKKSLGSYGDLTVAIVAMLIVFAVARFLYKRSIFIRV